MKRRAFAVFVIGAAVAATALIAQTPPPPTPTPLPKPAPFPGAQTPVPSARPASPAPASTGAVQDAGATDPRLAGVPMYPGALFLESFDVGSGQRVWVFGTNDLYADVVAFFKAQLKKSGEEVSRKTPAIQQFDLGSFDSGTMAQRPGILVKDFTWPDQAGYVHVVGTTEQRYKTLIQIIPVTK